MKIHKIISCVVLIMVLFGVWTSCVWAKTADTAHPTAIFGFSERGSGVKGYGEKVGDVIFASLVVNPNLFLVERFELETALSEQELNLSGVVNASQAVQVGQLVGAKIIVTGSIMEVDKTLFLVGKVIGTETSRVFGESVKGHTGDDIVLLAESLAKKISAVISKENDQLVAREVKIEDRIANLNQVLGKGKRPTVLVKVNERHVGRGGAWDPAAETEITIFCKETGFEVIDSDAGDAKQADILIKGEGFSEFATRRGNLISVKARLEVKAIDRATGEIIAIDRQTEIEVDLTEQIAGKKALQQAAASIAERILPKLIKR